MIGSTGPQVAFYLSDGRTASTETKASWRFPQPQPTSVSTAARRSGISSAI